MHSLDFNLATRPFRNNTLVWAGYLILFVAAVGFSYWNVSSYRYFDRELLAKEAQQGNRVQQQIDLTARAEKVVTQVGGFDVKQIGRQTSKANEVIEWKAFSWTRLFNRLEEMLPYKVRMTSVRPVFRDRDRDQEDGDSRHAISVTVEGLARDLAAFHEIQTKLINHDSFGWVKPRFATRVDNGEFAFAVDFLYYPGEFTPSEDSGDNAGEEAPPVAETEPPATAQARKEPVADATPSEVTDDWAERAAPEEGAATAKTDAPKPQRRSLPKVEPDSPQAATAAEQERQR